MKSTHPNTETTPKSTTWTQTIDLVFEEVPRTPTSETTYTTITVHGVPLIYSGAQTAHEIQSLLSAREHGWFTRELDKIKDLLVPKGQEVTLEDFLNPPRGPQVLKFRTICDHGD